MIITVTDEFIELSNLIYLETPHLLEIILSIDELDTQIAVLEINDAYDINLLKKVNEQLAEYKDMKVVSIVGGGAIPKRFKLKKIDVIKETI